MSNIPPEFAKLTYEQLSAKFTRLSNQQLIEYLNSSSVKVGDSAASELSGRGMPYVIGAFQEGLITTKGGKMRFCYLLGRDKNRAQEQIRSLLQLVMDRSLDVADTALFTLVKCNISSVIDELKHIAASSKKLNPSTKLRIDRAVKALEAGNPRIYSPNFGG